MNWNWKFRAVWMLCLGVNDMSREMKDSGVEWIGEMPEEWKIERLQWHLQEINKPNNPVKTEYILSLNNKTGVIPYEERDNMGNKAKEDYSQYKIAYPDTLVMNSMNVIIGSVGISHYYGCISPVYYTDAFKSCYADTISCSHPCLARYNKKGSKEYPVNCGYCYPCLIRKSSLLDIDEIKKYSYQGEAYDFLIEYEESEKSADLRAVLGSIYRCKHSSDKELKRYIRCVGELTEEEVEKFLSLYKKSIEDLVQLFSADQRMKEYLGL